MRATLPATLTGILFGAGLTLSDMVNPGRVLGFLDIAGEWDPTLLFVMGGAVIASAVGYVFARRLKAPLFGRSFFIPESRQLDSQLIGGAVVFGIGWGLVGFCPGPAVAGLIFGIWQPWLFVGAMIVGMAVQRFVPARDRTAAKTSPADA